MAARPRQVTARGAGSSGTLLPALQKGSSVEIPRLSESPKQGRIVAFLLQEFFQSHRSLFSRDQNCKGSSAAGVITKSAGEKGAASAGKSPSLPFWGRRATYIMAEASQ